jgi:hypothetical protein
MIFSNFLKYFLDLISLNIENLRQNFCCFIWFFSSKMKLAHFIDNRSKMTKAEFLIWMRHYVQFFHQMNEDLSVDKKLLKE